ncbi:hypothetical protein CV102_04845 [Natronococcus pandeyae]|uniref:Uncharacterized protein n=1 Tax=Natronococcus pandeyae TaxID=2055836 RepID=A0A8J8TR66_9EURY|nr:hypothetical protein [Natronococcus pandeyae]TYL39621.1 hypothetical protein CV102_04845 [Natronococcus pandeyae]
MSSSLADLAARLRARPIAATIELGSLLVCCLLFVGTVSLLASGAPTGSGGPWLLIVGVGAAFVVFWTVLVPLYERTL